MIARLEGHKAERLGFIALVLGAVVLLLSIAAQVALTHPFLDGTEQAQ